MIIHDPYAGEQGETWEPYDNNYRKQFCDIRLKNGEEWGACWPNAGKFIVSTLTIDNKTENKVIKESDVKEIRYYKD